MSWIKFKVIDGLKVFWMSHQYVGFDLTDQQTRLRLVAGDTAILNAISSAATMLPSVKEEQDERERRLSRTERAIWKDEDDLVEANPAYVYVIKSGGRYKIGRSKNVERRLLELGAQSPFGIDLVMTFKFGAHEVAEMEEGFHAMFAHRRARGEWFDLKAQDLAQLYSCKSAMDPYPKITEENFDNDDITP